MSIKCILLTPYLSWSFSFWQKSSLLLSIFSGSGIVFLSVLSVAYSAVSITIKLLFYFLKLWASIIRWYMVSATVRTFQYIAWAMAHFMIATAPTTSLSFTFTSGCYVTVPLTPVALDYRSLLPVWFDLAKTHVSSLFYDILTFTDLYNFVIATLVKATASIWITSSAYLLYTTNSVQTRQMQLELSGLIAKVYPKMFYVRNFVREKSELWIMKWKGKKYDHMLSAQKRMKKYHIKRFRHILDMSWYEFSTPWIKSPTPDKR